MKIDSEPRDVQQPGATRTLEIELVEVGKRSWLLSLLSTIGSPYGKGLYRFVAWSRGEGDDTPTRLAISRTFSAARTPVDRVPPKDKWVTGMTKELEALRDELLAGGWSPSGQGDYPWSDRYVRREP